MVIDKIELLTGRRRVTVQKFKIYFHMVLLQVTNSFSFCLSENILSLPRFFRIFLLLYNSRFPVFGLLVCFQNFKDVASLSSWLSCFQWEICHPYLYFSWICFIPYWLLFTFSLCYCFWVMWLLHTLAYISCTWGLLSLFHPWLYNFHHFWKKFHCYFFKQFLVSQPYSQDCNYISYFSLLLCSVFYYLFSLFLLLYFLIL